MTKCLTVHTYILSRDILQIIHTDYKWINAVMVNWPTHWHIYIIYMYIYFFTLKSGFLLLFHSNAHVDSKIQLRLNDHSVSLSVLKALCYWSCADVAVLRLLHVKHTTPKHKTNCEIQIICCVDKQLKVNVLHTTFMFVMCKVWTRKENCFRLYLHNSCSCIQRHNAHYNII